MTSELEPEEVTKDEATRAAQAFAEQCVALGKVEGWLGEPALDHLVKFLMTELWDRGFSQTEIRAAFSSALDEMNRYAAGEERR